MWISPRLMAVATLLKAVDHRVAALLAAAPAARPLAAALAARPLAVAHRVAAPTRATETSRSTRARIRMTRLPKRNTAETKTRHQMLLAFAVVSMGVLLVFVSFSVPPTGIIDASVLAAFGEMLTFAGSLIGIDYHYRYKSERYGEDEETAMER